MVKDVVSDGGQPYLPANKGIVRGNFPFKRVQVPCKNGAPGGTARVHCFPKPGSKRPARNEKMTLGETQGHLRRQRRPGRVRPWTHHVPFRNGAGSGFTGWKDYQDGRREKNQDFRDGRMNRIQDQDSQNEWIDRIWAGMREK